MKGATRRYIDQIRWYPFDGCEGLPPGLIQPRNGGQEAKGIGMARILV
jgi:hypothetical protein